jgi:hypothetical protein
MRPEAQKIVDLATTCISEVRKYKEHQEETTVLHNMKSIVQEDEDISTKSLISMSRAMRYLFMAINRGKKRGQDILDQCQKVQKELEDAFQNESRNLWASLIGENRVKALEKEYWVDFDKKDKFIYKVNEIEIEFLEKDNKQDTVIFFTLVYNLDEKKFYCENCISDGDPGFDTYEGIREHNIKVQDRIIDNNFTWVDLPE